MAKTALQVHATSEWAREADAWVQVTAQDGGDLVLADWGED